MSFQSHYFPPNIYGPPRAENPTGSTGYLASPASQLHPSVLHYRQNMMPQYSGGQQAIYFPPPPAPPPTHSPLHVTSPVISEQPDGRGQISPVSPIFPGNCSSNGNLPSAFLNQQLPNRFSHRQPHHQPAIHNFNLVAPRSQASPSAASITPPPPLRSAAHCVVAYPRSTVQEALMMSAAYPDREPGEVIINQPSESERRAMLSGVMEREAERDASPVKEKMKASERYEICLLNCVFINFIRFS